MHGHNHIEHSGAFWIILEYSGAFWSILEHSREHSSTPKLTTHYRRRLKYYVALWSPLCVDAERFPIHRRDIMTSWRNHHFIMMSDCLIVRLDAFDGFLHVPTQFDASRSDLIWIIDSLLIQRLAPKIYIWLLTRVLQPSSSSFQG